MIFCKTTDHAWLNILRGKGTVIHYYLNDDVILMKAEKKYSKQRPSCTDDVKGKVNGINIASSSSTHLSS